MGRQYESWGRYPKAVHLRTRAFWRSETDFPECPSSVLPFGLGRSYGDSCLNNGGTLIDMSGLDRFISLDTATGLLRCEAGVILGQVLEHLVPQGWFLPVVPGTKYVTVGGAIANDIHGKNHHAAGTFGCHVTKLELLRSDGARLICSPTENEELFRATIGGLGLTGIIVWAEIRLKKIVSPWIDAEFIRFESLDDFYPLAEESAASFEYTVSWIDCTARGDALGRGIFIRGNHSADQLTGRNTPKLGTILSVPLDMPNFLLNRLSIRAFNILYFYKQGPRPISRLLHYNPFFFPLDALGGWNKMYGNRGFFQYQPLIPQQGKQAPIKKLFQMISESGGGSFLTVLKDFGSVSSPGLMSFPRPGVTLALDFPNRGAETLKLFEQLDSIVLEHGGRIYPAKDARMSPQSFKEFYPESEKFAEYIDPKISSSFWRRVMSG